MYALTEILDHLLGERFGSGINAMYHCPLHEDRSASLSAHQDEGMWLCHSCGARGGIDKLAMLVGEELGPEIRWDMAIRSAREVPPIEKNFASLANSLYEAGVADIRGDTAIRNYLNSRSISIDARHHFWLGWDGKRISFPYWGDDSRLWGTCIGIKYRDVVGQKTMEEGSRRGIYNVEEIRGAGSVIICEGESDALLAWTHAPAGTKVCGIPGASIGRGTWEIYALDFLFAHDILMAFDADEAGDRGAALCAEVLGGKVRRMRPDGGLDLTDHFKKHGRLPDVTD